MTSLSNTPTKDPSQKPYLLTDSAISNGMVHRLCRYLGDMTILGSRGPSIETFISNTTYWRCSGSHRLRARRLVLIPFLVYFKVSRWSTHQTRLVLIDSWIQTFASILRKICPQQFLQTTGRCRAHCATFPQAQTGRRGYGYDYYI